MKTKTIGQLRSLFLDMYTFDQIIDDTSLQTLDNLLKEKHLSFGRDSLYIPQGEILSLLCKYAPSLVYPDNDNQIT